MGHKPHLPISHAISTISSSPGTRMCRAMMLTFQNWRPRSSSQHQSSLKSFQWGSSPHHQPQELLFTAKIRKLNKRTTNKMAFLAGLYRYRQLSSLPIQLNYSYSWSWCHHCPYPSYTTNRWLSSSESIRTEFPVENAYDILEVAETSSFAEIKASFRKLAKETHPDLVDSKNDSSASKHFVRILAAYEVLCVLAFFFSLSESH